jgi:hypothetical protein
LIFDKSHQAIRREEICSRHDKLNAEAISPEPGRQYQPSMTMQKNPVLLRRQLMGIAFQFKG